MAIHRHTQGFTLIELVVVIVILGILAAVAMPKFTDLSKEARIAKLNGLAGALHAVAQQWNAACLLDPKTDCLTTTSGVDITRDGITATIYRGYPKGGPSLNQTNIDTLLNFSGFSLYNYSVHDTSFLITNAPTSSACRVAYCTNNTTTAPVYCGPDTGTYRVYIFSNGC